MVFIFVSGRLSRHYGELFAGLKKLFTTAQIVGCSASGMAGRGIEVEHEMGLSLLCGWLPDVEVHPFAIDQMPDLDGPPTAWRDAIAPGVEDLKGLIVLADPFVFESDKVLAGLDFAYPGLPKVGGLASGCRTPGEAALFCGDAIRHTGCVGVGFSGAIEMSAAVAQGCEPIGEQLVITESRGNVIVELGGKPATRALVETVKGSEPRQVGVTERALFVGLGAGKPALRYEPGDFLVRQVMGIDPKSGCIAVAARLRKGQTIQFQLRDKETSRRDLVAVLQRHRQENQKAPDGALIFSCLGRGVSLYGRTGHDSEVFIEQMGEVPMAGFFCNGEFGPIGGESALHGFTSSFALFYKA